MIISHNAYYENKRQPKVNLTDGLNSRVRLVIPLTKKLSRAGIAKLILIRYGGLIVDFGLDALQEDSDSSNKTLQVRQKLKLLPRSNLQKIKRVLL